MFKLIHHHGTEHVHGQLYVDTSTLHASGTKPLDRSTPCTHNEIRPELFFFYGCNLVRFRITLRFGLNSVDCLCTLNTDVTYITSAM